MIPSERHGVAALFETPDGKQRAQILFNDNTFLVEHFRKYHSEEEAGFMLLLDFPYVDLITDRQFLTELDHINLFDARSNEPCYELPSHNTIVTYDTMSDYNLSDEEIDAMITEIETGLERAEHMVERYRNELFVTGTLDDPTRQR